MSSREELNLNLVEKVNLLGSAPFSSEALEKFKSNGLPHKKLEDYKYTNVDDFFPLDIKISSEVPNFKNEEELTPWMVFVNGHLDPKTINLPAGIELEVKKDNFHSFDYFDSLEDLNLLLKETTVELNIKSDSSFKAPIHISHTSNEAAQNAIVATRLKINVGKNAVVRVIEKFDSPRTGLFNRNHMVFINAEENSNVEHVKVVTEGPESFHFGSVNAIVKKSACFHSFTFTTGAKLSRNNINVELTEVGARGEVHGLYALRGEQHCDNFSHIHHRVERTDSEQLFKAVLDEVSHGIFTGKIVVHRNAQQVNSSQLNKNLLLSKKAHADTRPQLEVYADDVKCAHGATVGQLSEEELFYLESRAISPKDARVMLCHGFVQEALDKIQSVVIREYLEKLLYNEYEKDVHLRIREDK